MLTPYSSEGKILIANRLLVPRISQSGNVSNASPSEAACIVFATPRRTLSTIDDT